MDKIFRRNKNVQQFFLLAKNVISALTVVLAHQNLIEGSPIQ